MALKDDPTKAKKFLLKRKLPMNFNIKRIEIIENGVRYYFKSKKFSPKLRTRIILTPKNTYVMETYRKPTTNTIHIKYIKLSDLSKKGKSRL